MPKQYMHMDIKQLYKLYTEHPVITTDSRDCPPGSIFLALKGESFDGNQFAAAALEKGCAYAIVDNPAASPADDRLIVVDDCLQTFKDLAREHRRQFDIPVIGITGTNGKTTTKELIATTLSQQYNVLYTQGNFNNDVGVPKTLLRLTKEHEIAVIEMGASHPGDIKTLVETVEPTGGLITNVGRAHLQGFGSFEGVKRTKGELYDFLGKAGGLVFVNADSADLCQMAAERHLANTLSYGQADGASVRGEVVECNPYLKFKWTADGSVWHVTQTHLIGAYNIANLLAAVTVGSYFGVAPGQIGAALAQYTPSNNRSQLTVTSRNQLVVDAYNANPSSMMAALENFRLLPMAHKMVIIGDMRELGDASAEEHQRVTDFLGTMQLDEAWLVGEEFAKTRCNYRKFHDVEDVKAALAGQCPEQRTILIKGSNSMRLYQLPELL